MFYVLVNIGEYSFENQDMQILILPRYSDDIEEKLTELFGSEPLFVTKSVIKFQGDSIDLLGGEDSAHPHWVVEDLKNSESWEGLISLLTAKDYSPSVYDKM
jgi:hypothetical protein